MKINKIKTAKGKEGIEVNTFRYRKDKLLVTTGEVSWRCTFKNCSASLKTNSAVTLVRTKPTTHNHEPPNSETPSSPSTSEPSTPTSLTPSLQTPRFTSTLDVTDTPSQNSQPLSLTELLSPYTTLTPVPPRFSQQEEENQHLRQRVAELIYTNEALTDKLISLEKEIAVINQNKLQPTYNNGNPNETILTSSEIPKVTELNNEQMKESEAEYKQTEIVNKNDVPKNNPPSLGNLENIHVVNANMGDMIDGLRNNESIAFAHTISGDFHHHRRMSAGVAVVFKIKFGKPGLEDCITKSLTFQKTPKEAAVYGLITKPEYWGKPTESEYDAAFKDFTADFKRREFTTLVCSPMGCARDLISLDHFARNIKEFQESTGATVLIVTCDQKAGRKLRHGLSHPEFIRQLRNEIRKSKDQQHKISSKEPMLKPVTGRNPEPQTPWHNLQDEEMKIYLDRITIPENTLILDPSVSHLVKKSNSKDDVAEVRKKLKVDSYDFVLAAVNDRKDDSKEGGVHWSLLVYTRETDTFLHLDSLEPMNTEHAQQTAAKLSGDTDVNIVQLRCRRQEQGVECGAYVLHYIDLICSMIRNNINIQNDRCYLQNFSVNKIYVTIKQSKKAVQPKQKTTNRKQILLFSDSHGRSLRQLLHDKLGGRFNVTSVIKPNATIQQVTSGVDCDASNLGSSDHVVVLGGTNNIDLEEEFDVKSVVRGIAEKTKHTNLVIGTIPLRHDRSDLNVKIRKINIDLVMEGLKYEHVKVLSLSNMPVNSYTSHGLHFNNKGKTEVCNSIAGKITCAHLN